MSIRPTIVATFIGIASFITSLPAVAQTPVITRDPLKDYTRVTLDFKNEPFFLRAYLKQARTEIDIYIVKTHSSDYSFRTATVKWIDGTLKKPKLHHIDSDFNCSSARYGGGCRKTEHLSIDITAKSWAALTKWAQANPESSIEFQLQSNYSDIDFNFQLKARQITEFAMAISGVKKNP